MPEKNKKTMANGGMFFALCAFAGVILAAVYFILNFTVSPLRSDVKDVYTRVIDQQIRLIAVEKGLSYLEEKYGGLSRNPRPTSFNLDSVKLSVRDSLYKEYPEWLQKSQAMGRKTPDG